MKCESTQDCPIDPKATLSLLDKTKLKLEAMMKCRTSQCKHKGGCL